MALCVVFAVPASASAPRRMDVSGAAQGVDMRCARMVFDYNTRGVRIVPGPRVEIGSGCLRRSGAWGSGSSTPRTTPRGRNWSRPTRPAQFMALYYFAAQILSWAPPTRICGIESGVATIPSWRCSVRRLARAVAAVPAHGGGPAGREGGADPGRLGTSPNYGRLFELLTGRSGARVPLRDCKSARTVEVHSWTRLGLLPVE